MVSYGSDKPDLRFGMEIMDLTEVAKACQFKVFRQVAEAGGQLKGITVSGGAETVSRKQLDLWQEFAKSTGAKGLAWVAFGAQGIRSSGLDKHLTADELDRLETLSKSNTEDLILLVADTIK